MRLVSVSAANSWCAQAPRPLLLLLLPRAFSIYSSIKPADDHCTDFLPWLNKKAGTRISTALSIGKSPYGRALYASEEILAGDCVLKVPYIAQLAPDNLPPEISCLLGDEVGHVAKAALLILHEHKLGQKSQWAPYISRLPRPQELHSTIFWSYDELKMIQPSALYEETLRQKSQIEKDFWAVKLVFDRFPYGYQDVTLPEFTYAYGLVTSRAWESSRGVSMIPFADFLNHDGTLEAYVLSDESKQHSEVIADRDYAPGDQVMICYGKFSNATLLLDFGFTVTYNIFDQLDQLMKTKDLVLVELKIPQNDGLYAEKLELLDKYQTPSVKDINKFQSSRNCFTIKEVQNGSKKGKGIPQPLRAFCRILSSNSNQELSALVNEAVEGDGRLARYPLKNKNREIEAHQLLLSELNRLIEEHDASVKLLEQSPSCLCEKRSIRKILARDLLTGELRVLKSASTWLKNYCSALCAN